MAANVSNYNEQGGAVTVISARPDLTPAPKWSDGSSDVAEPCHAAGSSRRTSAGRRSRSDGPARTGGG